MSDYNLKLVSYSSTKGLFGVQCKEQGTEELCRLISVLRVGNADPLRLHRATDSVCASHMNGLRLYCATVYYHLHERAPSH